MLCELQLGGPGEDPERPSLASGSELERPVGFPFGFSEKPQKEGILKNRLRRCDVCGLPCSFGIHLKNCLVRGERLRLSLVAAWA